MLDHPVELLDGVAECITSLADDGRYRLLVITKGDLFHQESKVARSGLAELFWKIEIVGEKDVATYGRIVARHDIDVTEFAMVGNSLRSDIIPVVQMGATAIHVPYPLVWAHEHVDPATVAELRWHEVGSIAAVPALLDELNLSNCQRGAPDTGRHADS
jgi:putative hydrolase of the HAD superfamily